ncbi:Cwf5-like with 2 ZnR domains (CCCH and RRM domains missing) [Cryptosporidium felis]|nr:Cwf5-like with 2 ZnR domains (CCCH and RRM domains missing) [Cryptosporidium felis]
MPVAFASAELENFCVIPDKSHSVSRINVARAVPTLLNTHIYFLSVILLIPVPGLLPTVASPCHSAYFYQDLTNSNTPITIPKRFFETSKTYPFSLCPLSLKMSHGLSYEESNFPVVCDRCLGESKFLRMTKANQERSCKICNRPCTAFRWKLANSKKYNQTTICSSCAKIKNVCQSCVSDLNFGLPLYARDEYIKARREAGDEEALKLLNIPDSVDNRDHFMENKLNGDDETFNRRLTENQQIRKKLLEEILAKGNKKETKNKDLRNGDLYEKPNPKTTIKSISKA